MLASLSALTLVLAMGATGSGPQSFHVVDHERRHRHPLEGVYLFSDYHRRAPYGIGYHGRILPPGPGDGWGFPNNAPDGYGWYDPGYAVPLGADRTPEYYFRRYYAVPAQSLFLPNYYNDYTTRGQRYIPYAGSGGNHPMGGPPLAPSTTPYQPYTEASQSQPVTPLPTFSGRQEAPPENPGISDLIP